MKSKRPSRSSSDTPKDSRKPSQLSRRDLLKQGLLTAASFPLLAGTAWAAQKNHPKAKAPAPPTCTGIFANDTCYPGNSVKCATYDKSAMYPLIAFWLMLTTEKWDTCLQDPAWRKTLAGELGAKNPSISTYPGVIDYLYNNAFPKGVISPEFKAVRDLWQTLFLPTPPVPPPIYGGRPCPGGKTILEIAHLGSTHP
jgi:hypothetical protein